MIESLSSNPEILEALNYDTFTNLPHIDFFPVDAVYRRVSTGGL